MEEGIDLRPFLEFERLHQSLRELKRPEVIELVTPHLPPEDAESFVTVVQELSDDSFYFLSARMLIRPPKMKL